MEAEERRPSAEMVKQLAEIFHIPPEERKSFLRFARGDWRAFGTSGTEDTPWRVSASEQLSNLPALVTSFIGREREQTEILHLLKKNRLVTLAGIGGIGKTRLAIQVGNRLLPDYPHGIWFVALDSLSDPLLIPQTVASIFNIREVTDRPVMENLKYVLRGKTLLLILDNCEHLLEACRQFSTTLLTFCPALKILTTSREILNLEGEATYSLSSLSVPVESAALEKVAGYESVQLFVERARLALSTFELDEANSRSILDICRRVDGIPLAIELTAAHVNILNVEEISNQLHKSLAILDSAHRTTLSRHQTLQASLDWSWSLLSDSERVFLRQLSVFAGGWTLEAAEAVCQGNPLGLTSTLVQKSLIKVEQDAGRETRYYFHEMVHQYGRDKLSEAGDAQAVRDRHLAYFVKLVEQAEPELYRSNQIIWFNRLDKELDNFRTALKWALVRDVESGLRIAVIPWRFWQRWNYVQELGEWLRKLLERYSKSDSLRAQALAVCANYTFVNGNTVEARGFAEQGLQLARALSDRQNEALSLLFLGRSIAFPGNFLEGNRLLEESLALYRALNDKLGQAMATGWLGMNQNNLEHSKSRLLEGLRLHRDLGNLSQIAWCLTMLTYKEILGGNFAPPAPLAEETKTLYRGLGDQIGEADALELLGIIAHRQGNYQQAYPYFEQAITMYEDIGASSWSAWTRVRMAYAFLDEGNYQQARETFRICLQLFRQRGTFDYLIGVVFTIEGLASLHTNQGQLEWATRLFAWADAVREELDNHRPPVEQMDVNKSIQLCLAQLGEEAFSDAYEEGKKMSLDEAIVYALEES
jgi:predicted ATPase